MILCFRCKKEKSETEELVVKLKNEVANLTFCVKSKEEEKQLDTKRMMAANAQHLKEQTALKEQVYHSYRAIIFTLAVTRKIPWNTNVLVVRLKGTNAIFPILSFEGDEIVVIFPPTIFLYYSYFTYLQIM